MLAESLSNAPMHKWWATQKLPHAVKIPIEWGGALVAPSFIGILVISGLSKLPMAKNSQK